MKILLLLFFFLYFAPINAKIIFVSPDGKEEADGSSWGLAFPNIRIALEAAEYGDSIFLKEGVYGKFMDPSYEMKSGVRIFGGFNGTEMSLDQRGDVFNYSKIIGHNQAFICINTDSTTLIDGIYFEKNYASIIIGENDCNSFEGDYRCTGGAIFIGSWEEDQPACLQVNNCIFYDNAANYHGGAIYLFTYTGQGGLWIRNSTFKKNRSFDIIGINQPGIGGACAVYHGENFQYGYKFENCIFEENEANYYGAIQIARPVANNTVEFIKCDFIKNKAKYNGGAVIVNNASFNQCNFIENSAGTTLFFPGAGGAVIGDRFLFESCLFRSNKASYGGALYGKSFSAQNSQFLDNYSVRQGGAVFHSSHSNTNEDIFDQKYLHCTFGRNESDSVGGAIFATYFSKDSIINSLFFQNRAIKKSDNLHYWNNFKTLIYLDFNYFDSHDTSIVIGYPFEDKDSLILGLNNVFGGIDPKLGITKEGLIRPGGCSPLIQTANPFFTDQHNLNFDLAGRPRPTTGGAVGALEPIDWNPEWYSRDESCPEYLDGAVWLESDDPLVPVALSTIGFSGLDTLFLSKGSYEILAIDNAGCIDSLNVEIDGFEKWMISDTFVNPINGLLNGYIHINEIQGASPPLLIQWSTGEESCCIDGLTAGIYTASITDNIGCEKIITYELSFTIGTSSEELTSCMIYPNPAAEILYLDCNNESIKDIEIISIDGRIFKQSIIIEDKNRRIDLQHVPNGIYILRITDVQGKVVNMQKLHVLKEK